MEKVHYPYCIGTICSALILSLSVEAPHYVIKFILALIALSLVILLVVFICAFFRDPSLLRSEKFSLIKMAIEHWKGDDSKGVFIDIDGTIKLPSQFNGEDEKKE